jgi:hypothetical protein
MSASADIQSAIAALLEAPGALPVAAPVIRRREKEMASDIDAGAAVTNGLCLFVMPPVATSAVQGVSFVIFDGYEVRVRIIELPQMNITGADTYELIDAVSLSLHWQPTSGIQRKVAAVMAEEELDEAAALALVRADPTNASLFALLQILAHPLQLARRPVEMIEGTASAAGMPYDGKFLRITDVVFNAVLQINAPAS